MENERREIHTGGKKKQDRKGEQNHGDSGKKSDEWSRILWRTILDSSWSLCENIIVDQSTEGGAFSGRCWSRCDGTNSVRCIIPPSEKKVINSPVPISKKIVGTSTPIILWIANLVLLYSLSISLFVLDWNSIMLMTRTRNVLTQNHMDSIYFFDIFKVKVLLTCINFPIHVS